MLAHEVGRLAGLPVDCSALTRVPQARADAIKDKKIVVIDANEIGANEKRVAQQKGTRAKATH